MSRQRNKPHHSRHMSRQWWAAPAAFVATLLALPVNAGITIPDEPLATGVRVAPNVMFILDDSGSMSYEYMPDDVPETSSPDVSDEAYPRNTLSYNPAISYETWTQANGTKMTDGTSYTAAYGSFNKVGGTTIDLGSTSSCKRFNRNTDSTNDEYTGSSGTNVCGGVQTFYVPKDTSQTAESYLGDGENYWRYQILSGGSDIKRSEWGDIELQDVTVTIDNNDVDTGSLSNDNTQYSYTASVPAGVPLEIIIRNTHTSTSSNRRLRYQVYSPTGGRVCGSSNGTSLDDNSSDTCTIDSTQAGQYEIRVWRRDSATIPYSLSARRFTTNSCDGNNFDEDDEDWINCTSALPNPSKRDTVAKELTNYATWFSYHRTRMKAAKAGASLAFAGMDSRIRAGFRTIWRRSTYTFNIPVTDGNDGRFVNNPAGDGLPATTSRTQWYDKLFSVIGYNGTPLKGALQSAGEYFKTSDPYGPETGSNQYTCRQNYAILTTDGYWNDNDGFTLSGTIGNADGDNGAPYQDGATATLADVAMYYWENDLRSTLTNNVPTSDDDNATWQHMVTFGISIGLSGTVDQTSVAAVKANGGATYNNGANSGWPTPVANTATAIDDLLHAAVNGHGTFVAATNPTAFAAGLKAALSNISKRTSSYSNVATNSASLRSGAMVFNASYVSGSWTGDVKGYPITITGVSATPSWSANFPAWNSRKIYTNGGTFPTTAQTTALARDGVGAADYEVSGADNAKYIRGDQSLEGTGLGELRERSTLLGDIVGSSPEFVEDTNTLYVGSNDGMLHAFNASNGTELFAYVPGILDMSRLGSISRGDYATMHKFFVDGPLVASPRTLTPSQNILFGSLGRGGKGIFALDVSSPSTISASPTLWEKSSTSTDYGNLGMVLGKPVLAKVKTGVAAAIVGNGVNSANDKAVLLVVNLSTGAVIKEIDTGTGSSGTPNGLFAPTAILGVDGSIDYVYAGDMLGNLWKFNLKSSSTADWTATKLFTAKAGGGTGAVQPITGGIGVATDPKTFKRWVYFGTGRFLTTADAADTAASTQGMYGIIDEGTEVAYSDLQSRSLTGTGDTRTADAKATLGTDKKGWYITLPGAGERIVQDAQVVSNVLVTASMLPTGDGCDSAGSGYINAVDAFTGTSTGSAFFDLDGDGDTSDDAVTGSIDYGVGMPTLPIIFPGRIVVGGTGGSSGGGAAAPGGGRNMDSTWNRVSWREIRRD